jgi:parallel beta helix pectate lyase-like protein
MPTIQEAVQAAAPGDIIKIPAGVYDVGDLVLPSNITLQADGNATIVGNLHANGSNTVVQGFTFGGGTVDVANSHGVTVRDCVFNDSVSHSDNGSAIALNDASGVVIENNVFNRCQGVTLGNYNYDRVTIDHNTFTDCSQVLSLNSFSPASGNDIKFTNNYVSGEGRGGIETGGDGQYLTNLLVDGNTFSNLKGPAEIGPISVVARGDVSGTMITNNYIERGPDYFNDTAPPYYSQAIEIYGPATVSGNTIVDFSSAFGVYGSGTDIAGNKVFNTPGDIMGSEVLGTRPTAPLLPADPTPADPASDNPAPTDPASGSPAPTTPTTADGSGTTTPTDPVPTDPTPVDPTPAPGTGGTTTPPGHGHSAGGDNGHSNGHHALTGGTTALQDVQATQASDHSTGGQSVDATGNAAPTDGTTAQQDVQATQVSDHSTDGQSVDASGNVAPIDATTAQQDVQATQVPDHSTGGQSVDASGNVAPTDGTTASPDAQAAQPADGHATVSFNGITEPDAALTAPDAVSLEAAYQSAIDQHHSTSINFDVEGSAALDQNSISLRDHALVDLEAANPALKVAFTVAAQPTGLDANALSVLQSAKDDGVRIDAVKILVEHFGQSADGNSHTALISAVTAAEKQLADLGLDAKLGIAWDGNSAGAHADGAHAHDAHVASSDASGMVPQPFEFSGVLHHHDNIG